MSAKDLRVVAQVLRERARPMPDGDGRALLGNLADVFDEAAKRTDPDRAGGLGL